MAIKSPQLGSHHLLREVRRDGFGIIYEAGTDKDAVCIRAISPSISNSENFIVRFELLKQILPNLAHPNLVQIRELGEDSNVYYIAYNTSANSRTLADYDVTETPNRYRSLLSLFDGIAQGLRALNEFRDHYFKDGVMHDSLSPQQILISQESNLIGPGTKATPKITGFGESFLFFGDSDYSNLHHRIHPYTEQWKSREGEGFPLGAVNLFENESLYPPELRNGKHPIHLHLYSFGSLCYQYLTGRTPKGNFPSVLESDANLDPTWDLIIEGCLNRNEGFASIQDVLDLLRPMAAKFSDVSPTERILQETPVPEGMSLVVLHDKVELGASDGPEVEQPRFRARMSPFFIDTTPVTVSQFKEFLNAYQPSNLSKGMDHPATTITWHMAKAYCDWRSEREGFPKGTYRLPTEYEWEAACRGTTGEQYPWGCEMDSKRICCGERSEHGALKVKSLPAGRFGVYDLLGNIWEWTESTFKPHPFSTHSEPGYDAGLKTIKGGCWVTPKHSCRASLRAAFSPNERRGNVGFRCVRLVELQDAVE